MESKNALKSKTIQSGIITIVWGVLMMFGMVDPELPKTIDELGRKQNTNSLKVVGLGAMASGAMGIKGRYDAKTKIKRKGDDDE